MLPDSITPAQLTAFIPQQKEFLKLKVQGMMTPVNSGGPSGSGNANADYLKSLGY